MMNYLFAILGILMPLPETEVDTINFSQEVAPGTDFSYYQIVFYLLCFVVVLFLAAKVSRWLGGKVTGSSGSHLRLVETLYLGPNRAIHLIMVGKQLFLVGAAERNLTFLSEIIDPELLTNLQAEIAHRSAGTRTGVSGFADYLKGLLEGGSEHKESTNRPEVVTPTQRIEERLMKYRTHRGRNTDE